MPDDFRSKVEQRQPIMIEAARRIEGEIQQALNDSGSCAQVDCKAISVNSIMQAISQIAVGSPDIEPLVELEDQLTCHIKFDQSVTLATAKASLIEIVSIIEFSTESKTAAEGLTCRLIGLIPPQAKPSGWDLSDDVPKTFTIVLSTSAVEIFGSTPVKNQPPEVLPIQKPHLRADEYTHVIALVHGIKDIGGWQATVTKELKSQGVHVAQIRFGAYPAVRFLFPLNLSGRPTAKVLAELRNLQSEYKNARISIIAHSFGTYVVQRVLQSDHNLKLWKLVFCGSVANDQTDWAAFKHRVGDGIRPTKDFILNDCGTGDYWPVFGTAFGWHYGMAGVTGFSETHVMNRFHRGKNGKAGRHSLYFDNEFVQKKWRPFLIDDQEPAPGDGVQGEHLCWCVKMFYYSLVQWPARILALMLWIVVPCVLLFATYSSAMWIRSQFISQDSTITRSIAHEDSPVLRAQLPDPTRVADFPSPMLVSESTKTPLENVLLVYRNESKRNLRLLLFDCAMHYRVAENPNDSIVRSCFRDWPFVPTGPDGSGERFSRFPANANWFGFYIFDVKNQKSHFVGFRDLTKSRRWLLVASEKDHTISGELKSE